LFRGVVPAGGTCGVRPCWRASATGLHYRDPLHTPEGMATVRLTKMATGGAKVLVKGHSPLLLGRPFALPAPPLGVPVTVQLRGKVLQACFEAVNPRVVVDEPGRYRAKVP